MQSSADQEWFLDKRAATTQRVFFWLSLLFLIGLFFSRALLSGVPSLLFIFMLTRGNLKDSWQRLKQNRSALGIMAIYGLLVISILYTEEYSNWLRQLFRYLSLLLLPAAGALAPSLGKKQLYILLGLFLLLTTAIAIGTMGQYLLNIEAQNQLIIHSQNPPTINKIFHIHFGIMMALAIFFGVYLYRSPLVCWHKTEKYVALGCVVILFISIHVLAYRTGLLALYGTLLFKIYGLVQSQKRYLLGGALFILLVMVPLGAYYALESVQLRVENTRRDIRQYTNQRDINYYSISQRLAAWETALEVIKRNWLVGVGPADIKREMQRQYDVKDFGLKEENQVMIHNQYLHILMGSGIVGLLLFLFALIYPFRRLAWQKDFCATSFLLVMGAAMLVDSFFELQRGLNLFAFFYMLLIVMKEQRLLPGLPALKPVASQPIIAKGR